MKPSESTYQFMQYTGRNFHHEVLENSKPVVVICAADWIGDVYIMTPIIEDLVRRYDDTVIFGKLDMDKYSSVASQYCSRQNLTILLFKNGQLVNQIQGSTTKESLIQKINELLNNDGKK